MCVIVWSSWICMFYLFRSSGNYRFQLKKKMVFVVPFTEKLLINIGHRFCERTAESWNRPTPRRSISSSAPRPFAACNRWPQRPARIQVWRAFASLPQTYTCMAYRYEDTIILHIISMINNRNGLIRSAHNTPIGLRTLCVRTREQT